MALTGLQIFKLLPGGKKEPEANCKKCGSPTCMAFAMKLAKKQTTIDKCPYASDELKSQLEEAMQVQQVEVKFGPDSNIKIGGETVMFRHEKTFVNPTCISVKLESNDKDFDKKLDEISSYEVERVGEFFKVNAIALYDSASKDDFTEAAKKVNDKKMALILVSENAENIESALEVAKDSKPLVYLINNDIVFDEPFVVDGDSIEELAIKSNKMIEQKQGNMVLKLNNLDSKKLISDLTYIRRLAIEQKFKPLGFPVITFMDEIKGIKNDIITKALWTSVALAKYSNIIVLDEFDKAVIYALSTLKQNIYTDPQKPLQVEAKLYEIGDVAENSPVFVTTNFALTYFSVVSEIESSNKPSYLLITPSDGMSVLTAWAASKFTGEVIAAAVKDSGLEDKIKHRELIISGYVDTLKEEIEDELEGWNVVLGPNEASEIIDFLKSYKVN